MSAPNPPEAAQDADTVAGQPEVEGARYVAPYVLPEGMTAEVLRKIANWFDLHDELAQVYLSALVKAGATTEADVVKSMTAFAGREIQEDLLRWAGLIAGVKNAPTAEDWAEAVRQVRSYYPEGVFPAFSTSTDARSGTFARHLCDLIQQHANARSAGEDLGDGAVGEPGSFGDGAQ